MELGVLHACTYVHVRALACIYAAARPQALADPEPDLVKAYTTCMHAGSSVYVHARYPTNASLRFTSRARVRAFSLFVLAPSFPPFLLQETHSSLVGFMKAFQIVL